MDQTSRRTFLARTALAATAGLQCLARPSRANDPIGRTRPSHLKLSLAAYSYKPHLQGPAKKMDLFDVVNIAADLGLDAVEPTSYYFPEGVTTDYLHRLRRHAFLLGLDISGTSVMNDFCNPPGPELDKELAHVRAWIDRAAELNAPTVRILSGNWIQGTSQEELSDRVIRAIEALLPHAAEKGVVLALENHGGGVTTTADELLRIVRRVKSPYFGVNLDTGNFHTRDPYDDLARVAPYAVNVQVKTEIRRAGKTTEPADLSKVIGILRDAKYSGYVVLEYTAKEDPMTAVPRYIKELRSLIM
jgi:sugar phosphate isomerase/epimerase